MSRLARRSIIATLLVLAAALLAACSSDDEDPTAGSVLPAQTVNGGDVEVKLTPTRLDATGAVFTVVFDTHTVELSLDPAAAATLDVDGTTWPVQSWDGPGAGGHHRSGELRFNAAGPATGTARLTITGLPEPVEATWTLSSP